MTTAKIEKLIQAISVVKHGVMKINDVVRDVNITWVNRNEPAPLPYGEYKRRAWLLADLKRMLAQEIHNLIEAQLAAGLPVDEEGNDLREWCGNDIEAAHAEALHIDAQTHQDDFNKATPMMRAVWVRLNHAEALEEDTAREGEATFTAQMLFDAVATARNSSNVPPTPPADVTVVGPDGATERYNYTSKGKLMKTVLAAVLGTTLALSMTPPAQATAFVDNMNSLLTTANANESAIQREAAARLGSDQELARRIAAGNTRLNQHDTDLRNLANVLDSHDNVLDSHENRIDTLENAPKPTNGKDGHDGAKGDAGERGADGYRGADGADGGAGTAGKDGVTTVQHEQVIDTAAQQQIAQQQQEIKDLRKDVRAIGNNSAAMASLHFNGNRDSWALGVGSYNGNGAGLAGGIQKGIGEHVAVTVQASTSTGGDFMVGAGIHGDY